MALDRHPDELNRMDALAQDVLKLSRNTLLVNLRFMDKALNRFTLVTAPKGTYSTDGKNLFYNPVYLLKRYKEEKEACTRDYLHIVLHGIFRHMYIHTLLDQPCWNLACDIAVENIINELDMPCTDVRRANAQMNAIAELRQSVKQLTAEKLYRYFLDSDMTPIELMKMEHLFEADDHKPWYVLQMQKHKAAGADDEDGEGGEGNDGDAEGIGGENAEAFDAPDASEDEWKEISESIQEDLETFNDRYGISSSGMTQNLEAVNREKYDYESFLKKCAVYGEELQINDDEFDYIFYTYGLKLYENMPLVEPLEYRDLKRIKEFVIAIDTSGSVSGPIVQNFVIKTYNILKSTESFFSKVNIHIVQCDTQIQEDKLITCQEDFDEYIKTMQLHGFGGTDFRPVFNYVEDLIKEKKIRNLKGLFYFTDGIGIFPEDKPPYTTAFVFLDDEMMNPEVPPWAIKLILSVEDIKI